MTMRTASPDRSDSPLSETHRAAAPTTTRLASIAVPARDGHRLAVDVHLPIAAPLRAVAVLAPAMGVPRSFYRPFATFLADGGIATLVPDYRGIGGSRVGSLRDFGASLHDWADLDLSAVIAHARTAFPSLPVVWVGHSVGGQLLGLLPDAPVERALLVGSQHGHWRSWPGWPRFAMAALWYVGIPVLTTVAGRLPMKAFGQGEDLPREVAREWARWGRDREYNVGFARRRGRSGFDTFTGALRSYAITDDGYAPPRSVHALARAFRATRAEVIEISPGEVGLDALGHFAAFRARAQPLWQAWRDWLLATPAS
jgi:predicted alpha/beta hydrolase